MRGNHLNFSDCLGTPDQQEQLSNDAQCYGVVDNEDTNTLLVIASWFPPEVYKCNNFSTN